MSTLGLDTADGRRAPTMGGGRGGGIGTLVALVLAIALLVVALWLFGGEATDGSDPEQAPVPVTTTDR